MERVVFYMLAMYICTMHNRIYTPAVWVEAQLYISLRFVINLSCLCSAVSLSLSRSRVRSSLAVFLALIGCDGFRALLEVFRIY